MKESWKTCVQPLGRPFAEQPVVRGHGRLVYGVALNMLLAAVSVGLAPAQTIDLPDTTSEINPGPMSAPPTCPHPPCVVLYQPPPPLINGIGMANNGGLVALTITGRGLTGASSVWFGGAQASAFYVVSDSAIAVWPPNSGPPPGSTVPVTAIVGGHTVASTATYSTPIASMSVTGPIPYDSQTLGDPYWYNGGGHHFAIGSPGTLTFTTPSPVFHVTATFDDDSYAHPESLTPPLALGNRGNFTAILQVCSLAAPGSSDGACTNFDNNTGYWVDVTRQDVTINSPGSGQSLDQDMALSAASVFDQANVGHTFRLKLWLQQADSNTSMASVYRQEARVGNPFNAIVTPAALLELNVLPYTLLYHPPGNQSMVSFGTEATYGINFKVGNSTTTNNQRTDEQSRSTQVGVQWAFGGFGASFGGTYSWDHSVTEGWGTTDSTDSAVASSLGFKGTWSTVPDPRLIPGSGDTCASSTNCSSSNIQHDPNIFAQEPFWEDTFVLLVHPQFAVWVQGSGPDRYVMYGSVPVTANISVAELAACAAGKTLLGQDPCKVEYSDTGLLSPNGQGIVYYGSSHFVTLTHQDAHSLLLLDPFYVYGQGVAIDVGRGIPVASVTYGAKVGELPITYDQALNNTKATNQGQDKSLTHSTSVVDLIGNSESNGLEINKSSGDYSKSGGDSSGEGQGLVATVGENFTFGSTTNTNYEVDMSTTFTDSTAVSHQVTTTAEVFLNDVDNTTPGNSGPLCSVCHNPLPQRPRVNILLDRKFGSLMFQDPDAPAWITGTALTVAPLIPGKALEAALLREQGQQRFPDVPTGSLANAAIGFLAKSGIVTGFPDGTFQPNAPLTKGQLMGMIARALNLPDQSENSFDSGDLVSSEGLASELARTFHLKLMPSAVRSETVTRASAAQALLEALKNSQ